MNARTLETMANGMSYMTWRNCIKGAAWNWDLIQWSKAVGLDPCSEFAKREFLAIQALSTAIGNVTHELSVSTAEKYYESLPEG